MGGHGAGDRSGEIEGGRSSGGTTRLDVRSRLELLSRDGKFLAREACFGCVCVRCAVWRDRALSFFCNKHLKTEDAFMWKYVWLRLWSLFAVASMEHAVEVQEALVVPAGSHCCLGSRNQALLDMSCWCLMA